MHAFLIIAHNNFPILERLLLLLDHSQNDIYLHIDIKCHFDYTYYTNLVKKSNLMYVERINVKWGDISLVECEYILFEAALKKGGYSYYHLLSGVDLPIKKMTHIHRFFKKNYGAEFISFVNDEAWSHNRVKHIWFTRALRTSNPIIKIINRIIYISLKLLMQISKYDRIKNSLGILKKGDEWVSLTESAVSLIVSKKQVILNKFKYSIYADEVYKQTLLYNSPFKQKIYSFNDIDLLGNSLREIDWNRGTPYVYRLEDLSVLLESTCLFARKFDHKNLDLVSQLYDYLILDDEH